MNLIITGSSGFIGSSLINYISKIEPKIKLIAVYNRKKPQVIKRDIKYIKININKKYNLNFINKDSILIHLAWSNLTDYNSPTHLSDHLESQKKFMKSVILKNPKAILVLGTCFEYKNSRFKHSEKSTLKPINNYAKGKNLLRIYIKKIIDKKIKFTWGRLFYVYGLNQKKKTIFGQFMNTKPNKTLSIKNSNIYLDYLHIDKVCKYIIKLSTNNKNNNEVNICSGKKISIKLQLIQWIKKYNKNIKIQTKNNLSKIIYIFGSNTKLKKIINEK